MMPRLLAVLWLTLVLSGCEKPAAQTDDRKASTALALPSERRKSRPRHPSPELSRSPREIMEEADHLETPAAREKVLAGVAWNAIETDPALAHEALLRLPTNSVEKIRLIQHYAMTLAESDVEEALEWADTLGSDAEIAAAKAQIAIALAETEPRRAASLLSESGVGGREFDVAVVQVIQRWAAKSPADAAAWVSSFPQMEAREAGIRVIAERWLPADAESAFAWLDGLTDSDLRQESARALAGVIIQQPEKVREAWLGSASPGIRDEIEQQREHAIKDVGDNIPSGGL